METIIQKQDVNMVAILKGRLDTAAAPDTEKAMGELINGTEKEIILDCTELEYISSAGLRIFLTILAVFAPIVFALSIVPPWSSAWSQWISKYLSLTLWGFVVYMCLYYIDFILLYNLQEDITAYTQLLHGDVTSWGQIGALGIQGIGANCMYAMGMLVGAYVMRFVPEVSSWLIPGGVSSSAGTAAGTVAAAVIMGAKGYAMGTAKTVTQTVTHRRGKK